ncbi:MAG: alpha/beta fold hydrolase BchO [Pseudomonadota bacterium]
MNWARLKPIWPHAAHSHFLPTAKGRGRWHVQILGDGPDLLLIHGAGGATQSFRGLLPLLAEHHRCIAIDLPGQGFSRPGIAGRYGIDAMAADIGSLLWTEGWRPEAIIGHSAGAALALRLAEAEVTKGPVIGINAALGKFEGVAGWAFPLAARMMALNPLTALAVSNLSGSQSVVNRLLDGTGSQIDAEGRTLYRHLASSAQHVDGTLRMMAGWTLDPLLARLPRNAARTVLITAAGDRTVPPSVSEKAAARMPNAELIAMPDLGHLAHEEAPARIADYVREALAEPAVSL